MKSTSFCILAFAVALIASCHTDRETAPAERAGWLRGDTGEKMDTLARHLRGNDLVMLEVGRRYKELYWAGLDQNWEYGRYQLKKMRLAMDLGRERRPDRATSYDWFFAEAFLEMNTAVSTEDAEGFEQAFRLFTEQCNICHKMEGLPFFGVTVPQERDTIIYREHLGQVKQKGVN